MIKQVLTESKDNKFNFIKGDYVFELEKPKKFYNKIYQYFLSVVNWEACLNSKNEVQAIAFHHKDYLECLYIMNNFTKKFNYKVINQYQLI